jgi:hypothetical protein
MAKPKPVEFRGSALRDLRAFPEAARREAGHQFDQVQHGRKPDEFDMLHRIYTAHLKTPQAREELDTLSSLVAKSGPVCILCYERDHQHCHRQWIAEIIEDRDGVKVENLTPRQT